MLEPLFEADGAGKISRTRGEDETGIFGWGQGRDGHRGFRSARRHGRPLFPSQVPSLRQEAAIVPAHRRRGGGDTFAISVVFYLASCVLLLILLVVNG